MLHQEVGDTELFNKIKNSLIKQLQYLFVVSTVVILALWVFFYNLQIHQTNEHKISKYFSIISYLQPLMAQMYDFQDGDVENFNMRIFNKDNIKNEKVIFQRGDGAKGFRVLKISNKTIIHSYNPMSEIYLEDLANYNNHLFIHTVFGILLIIQFLLFFMLRKLLNPLSTIHNKLKNLQKGDMSKLEFNSSFEEVNQIVTSYNHSISQLKYIIETRKMFNKIFMHELKMPLAKGMFYLKLEPSRELNTKMAQLLQSINDELDEFSILESLIVHKEKIEPNKYNFIDLLNEAIAKVGSEKKENITILTDTECYIWGDKELWVLCFKNLLDNGLKYATDNKIIVTCKDNEVSFSNRGQRLPVDISGDLTNWKIDKNQRHKSSTGYGFGLFIIKNIVKLNGYELDYIHENGFLILKIKNSGAKYSSG